MSELSTTPNARLTEIYDAFVEAGRQVVRDLHITEDELHLGSKFVQDLGAAGFLVGLVDVAFATAASEVEAESNGVQKANLEGPLYAAGAPVRPDGNMFEHAPTAHALPLTLRGRVFNAATGEGISGAELDFWQADEYGVYDLEGYHLRGIIVSDADGYYELTTIVPEAYTTHEDDLIADLFAMMGRHAYRSAHIHVKVRVAGEHVLTTQFFDPGSRFLEDDYVTGAVRPDLMMERTEVVDDATGETRYEGIFDFPLTVPA